MPEIPENDRTEALQAEVRAALADGEPLAVRGGGTKQFYGREVDGRPLNVSGHSGVVSYEPTELVVTARAGTRLAELEALLAEHGQQLACEPPHFGAEATVGGMVAAGLAGPRRPWGGAVRDAVLGAKVLNGAGEVLSFGGEVMKNVAGYDLSRLLVGSLGTLGVLLEVSLKVLPRPAAERTRVLEVDAGTALARLARWGRQPLPITGAAHLDGRLHVRLAGNEAAVAEAGERLGGEEPAGGPEFWADLREQRLEFFAGEAPLWRLSVPPAAPPLDHDGSQLIDWGGAQRWLRGDAPAEAVRAAAAEAGGHATLFRGGDRTGEVFHPLPGALLSVHRNLKRALDPHGLFHPGRMYGAL
ncbi:glycolate oxidase [Thiohalorhabdus denitrificans]|uniref:Glycolate oxidase FAD binding subunit n=1 Tax=Thiohalorhabdus denitrificans TaxID=381306 RepID=A0A0P9C8Y3_9GAMM|nr:glycolate oxidase subunit GlcE [Thiohalorhabdus denitrificans]KPV41500.1 glycolate oxidase [Thiohalorhabdus denitrificans]SCY29544.1 glycolate oxidase FAD binding subunit [Thiohalorhabdus denitrificans]